MNLKIDYNDSQVTSIESGSAILATKEKYMSDNISAEVLNVSFYDNKLVAKKPTNTTVTETYTGSVITNGYKCPAGVSYTGLSSGTTAGTYTAVYTPNENCTWEDGTQDAVSVSLTILLDYLCFTANTAGSTISFPKLFEYSTDQGVWNTPSSLMTNHTGWNDYTMWFEYEDEITDYINYEVRAEPCDYLEAILNGFSSIEEFDNFLLEDYGWSQNLVNKLTTMPPERASTITLANAGDKIYVRNGSVGTPTDKLGRFIMTGSISASGNIMSLVDNTCQTLTVPCNSCFGDLFRECTSLTTAPSLPATTLAAMCYKYMFYGCTSLSVSDTQTSAAPYAWRIPKAGTFTNTYAQSGMFTSCAGTRSSDTMPGASGQSYTYYTQNQPV